MARALAADAHVGLGTGNLERAAVMKLAAVDMAHLFAFGGYGSDAEDRAELLEVGARRGAALAGVARQACQVVVVGDTLRDIAAGRSIGARVVAVATGGTARAELESGGADVVLDTLADVERALAAVLES